MGEWAWLSFFFNPDQEKKDIIIAYYIASKVSPRLVWKQNNIQKKEKEEEIMIYLYVSFLKTGGRGRGKKMNTPSVLRISLALSLPQCPIFLL